MERRGAKIGGQLDCRLPNAATRPQACKTDSEIDRRLLWVKQRLCGPTMLGVHFWHLSLLPRCVAGIKIRLICSWVGSIKGVPCGNEVFENASPSLSGPPLRKHGGTS